MAELPLITAEPPEPETLLFRPNKKRKIYRQRPQDDDADLTAQATSTAIISQPAAQGHASELPSPGDSGTGDVEGMRVSMAEILKLRKLRKHRVGGVEFRVASPAGTGSSISQELVPADSARDEIEGEGKEEGGFGVVSRFAKQTGMVGDVDKHMMAYIDSELAKRRQGDAASQTSSNVLPPASQSTDLNLSTSQHQAITSLPQRQPATLGKIQEVDLGTEARARNALLTDNARRRMAGEHVTDEPEDGKVVKPKKVRIGPDGKPWRGKKRRGSEDIKRDQLVDQVMRENRIELYEEPVTQELSSNVDSGENDDRLAEAFRREFMDSISSRQKKKPPPPANAPARGPGGKKEEDIMKGPKLGGSRSARAAMREMQLKAAAAPGKK